MRFVIKPKIIAVLRSGIRPRKAVRVLLNRRNATNFENVLADLTNVVKLDSGAVRKVFTLEGKPVLGVADFVEPEVFIAYGSDKCQTEDFDLDIIEFRWEYEAVHVFEISRTQIYNLYLVFIETCNPY